MSASAANFTREGIPIALALVTAVSTSFEAAVPNLVYIPLAVALLGVRLAIAVAATHLILAAVWGRRGPTSRKVRATGWS